MGNSYLNEGRPTFYAAEKLTAGQMCVLTAEGKATPFTTALATANKNTALLFALTDAEAGTACAFKLAGSVPGSVLALGVAGSYVPGAAVYAANGGKVTATAGTRLVGVYLGKSTTVADGGAVEIAPVFAVLS